MRLRRPAKYPFINLLAACAWSQDKPRSAFDFARLGTEIQGRWLERLVAQELWRRRCIQGEQIPELLPYWQGGEHELDFVLGPGMYIEVKRGQASPVEFAWFPRAFAKARLLVVSASRFQTESIQGITFEDFLSSEELPV